MVEKSFSIIRANPALTGNVKLVADKSGKLYLESYKSNRALSQERFNHYEIKKDDYLFDKIPRFFRGLPNDQIFKIRTLNDQDNMYDDFQYQFDDLYLSGAAFTEDTYYQEEFEYTQPLWVVPEKYPAGFIILRIDDSGLEDENTADTFRAEILDKWKLIDFYDLSEETNLGKFIRRNFEYEYFPISPTEITFEDGRFSTINGIDVQNSGFTKVPIDLDRVKKQNTPQFKTEEQFTDYWRLNNVIMPNIVNMKFLFDDNPATRTELKTWSINRYMGFYLDEIKHIKQISPYIPFELNKTPNGQIESLTPQETNEMPFLYQNIFVRDFQNQRQSFDPISGGYDPTKIFWVEWQGMYYQIERIVNNRTDILGRYLYRVVSDQLIQHTVPDEILNPTVGTADPQLVFQYQKVLINELTTLKHGIEIIDQLDFENITAENVIQSINPTFITYERSYVQFIPTGGSGVPIWGFTLTLQGEDNTFTIDNYDESDMHWIEIFGEKHLIKRYDDDIPNVGGLYYIDSDKAFSVNSDIGQSWINNGINTREEEYYQEYPIQVIDEGESPYVFGIYRASFTDVQDFDFDRTETGYSRHEYDREDQITETIEPKMYHLEKRDLRIKLFQPQQLNSDNFSLARLRDFLLSDPTTYEEFLSEDIRYPTNDANDQIFFSEYSNFVDFKLDKITKDLDYYVGVEEKSFNVQYYLTRLPLYINPTRIAVQDLNGGQATDPTTGEKLWQMDWRPENDYLLTSYSRLKVKEVPLNRIYYREEGYRLLIDDTDPNNPVYIDFIADETPTSIRPTLTWDNDYPMATSMTWSPTIQNSQDPNEEFDGSYIPSSTEYSVSDELFEIRNSNLSRIWDKNQSVVKWGLSGSLGLHDYSYRLGLDLEVNGLFNESPNAYANMAIPVRQFRDLDYFYRFGVNDTINNFDFQTLHLKEPFFDVDTYLSEYDYFDWVFNTDMQFVDRLKMQRKWSVFGWGDRTKPSSTVFRGIQWRLYDVNRSILNQDDLEEGIEIVEDYERILNPDYNSWRFSIVMGRKLSGFIQNSGDGDGDFGVDVYLNEMHKNVVIHIYFETDGQLTFKQNINGQEIDFDLELSEIDDLYRADSQAEEDSNPDLWDLGRIRVNGLQEIGDIRIRDLKLFNFLAILADPNYSPPNGSGRRPVQWIRIQQDGSVNIMDSVNTDFILEATLPERFLMREQSYNVESSHQINLDINNSVKNRITLDDDPNSPTGSALFTSDGTLVGSITDPDSWNGDPVSRSISYIPATGGNKAVWDLKAGRDPEVQRFSGPYMPIFKHLNLWRPISWFEKFQEGIVDPNIRFGLGRGNWKFYDPSIFTDQSNPKLYDFGYIEELIYSKVNRQGNILQLSLDRPDIPPLYPMVDEFGYDYQARFLFQSTWDREYYLESRRIDLPKNDYPGVAGYCVFLDGNENRLIIPDNPKFNLIPESFSILDPQSSDNLDLSGSPWNGNYESVIEIFNYDDTSDVSFRLVNRETGQSRDYTFDDVSDLTTYAATLPDDFMDQMIHFSGSSAIQIRSTKQLDYKIIASDDTSNTNGRQYRVNLETSSGSSRSQRGLTSDLNLLQIRFRMITDFSGTFEINLQFQVNNVGEIQFNATTFENQINDVLNPNWRIQSGSIEKNNNNLSFIIEASQTGPEYNFTIEPIKNVIENPSSTVVVSGELDLYEKGTLEEGGYLGLSGSTATALGSGDITIEFWVRVAGFNKKQETILFKGSRERVSDWSWRIVRDENKNNIRFDTRSYILRGNDSLTNIDTSQAVYTHQLSSRTSINDGLWHHVAVVFNTSTKSKKIYIDAQEDASTTNENFTNLVIDPTTTIEDKDWPIFVGGNSVNGNLNWSGNIDELRIWNFPRTRSDIQNNRRLLVNPLSYRDPQRQLLGYWRFDEQAGVSEIVDQSETIFNVERTLIVRYSTNQVGLQVIEETSRTFYQEDISEHEKSSIRILDQNIEFEVSGAEIDGEVDERYTIQVPPLPVRRSIREIPQQPIERSRFIVEFQRPPDQIEEEPASSDPVPATSPTVKTIQPKAVPEKAKTSLKIKPKREEKRETISTVKRKSSEQTKLITRIDTYNKKRQLLEQNNRVDDSAKLKTRVETIQRNPIDIIQKKSKIDRGVDKKLVQFSKDQTSLLTKMKNILSNPLKRLFK